MLPEFKNLKSEDVKMMIERQKELWELYGINESEKELVNQLAYTIRAMYPTISPELYIKLLKALSAQAEVLFDCLRMIKMRDEK